MWEKIFGVMVTHVPSRRQMIRLSRAMMNMALGDNNDDIETNGELLLLRGILDSSPKEALKFTVFDVGAHIGQWTIFLLNLAQERGIADKITIHCFEPSSFTFSQLRKLLLKHRYGGRICAVNSGMGNAEERRKLYICHNGAGTNSLYKRRLEGHNISYDKSEIVQITTVDAYCYKNNISHIDFMKIDVEGHEQAVVQGAKNMLKQHAIDYIQFEYGGCWIDSRKLLIDMYDFLTSFGYVIGKIMPGGLNSTRNTISDWRLFKWQTF